MAVYRVFRCQILTLSKIRGQHTEAPWNFNMPMCCFFLASIFEIVKWAFRFSVPGGHISVVAYASLGWHRRVPHPKTMQIHYIGQVKSTLGEYGRVWAMVRTKMISNTHMSQLEMWPPDPGTCCIGNLKIHFPISNIDARKKLKICACAIFQGDLVCWPRALLNVDIWKRNIRYAAIFLWFQLSRGVCSW